MMRDDGRSIHPTQRPLSSLCNQITKAVSEDTKLMSRFSSLHGNRGHICSPLNVARLFTEGL